MTISTEVRRAGPFTGTGAVNTYAFAFKIFATTDVVVTRTDLSNVETTLTLTTHYTISMNADQDNDPGGDVVLVANLTSGYLLTITSDVPELQSVELTNLGGFYPAVLNPLFDKLVILCQQISEKLGRQITLPVSSTYSDIEIPDPQAGYYLQWKADLSGLQNVAFIDSTAVSPFVVTLLNDTTALAFLTTLGIAYTDSVTPGTVAASKAVVVDSNKDALGFRKITGSTSTGYTASFTYTGSVGGEAAIRVDASNSLNNARGMYATASGATGIAVSGEVVHTTGINTGGYFSSASSAGFGVYAVTTVAGGIPLKAVAFDAADANVAQVLYKGTQQLRFNPRSSAAGYANPIVQDNDQVIDCLGAGSAIDTGVLTLAPYATDAVGIRIDSTNDTVNLSGTLIINGDTYASSSVTSWTPTLLDYTLSASEGQTYAFALGQYYVVGKIVFFQFQMQLSSLGTLTVGQDAYIGGLPIASATGINYGGGGSIDYAANVNVTNASGQGMQLGISTNVQYMNLYQMIPGTSVSTTVTIAEITSTGILYGHGQYFID